MVKTLGFGFNVLFSWSLLLGVCVALPAGWLGPYMYPRVKRQKWPGLLQTQAWSNHDLFLGFCERVRLSPRCEVEVPCSVATSLSDSSSRGIEASGCSWQEPRLLIVAGVNCV